MKKEEITNERVAVPSLVILLVTAILCATWLEGVGRGLPPWLSQIMLMVSFILFSILFGRYIPRKRIPMLIQD